MTAPDNGTHRKRRLMWKLAVVAFVIAIVAVVMAPPPEPPEKLVWMTSAQVKQALKPGRLMQLKYKIMRWPGPWRWLPTRKPWIQIETRATAIPSGTALPIVHADFCLTNLDGETAWIVGPEELKKLQASLDPSGTEVPEVMRMTVADGMQAALSNAYRSHWASVFQGTICQMLPKIEHGAVKLLVEAAWTQPAPLGGAQTNVSVSAQATIPNGGALVVKSSERTKSGTSYCFIISCTAIDAKGNPLKPGK